ncbi:MAG TPA: hypothetical protein VK210_05080 [Terriglobia bacterium]|nr:hypothetical protein [Terriglobia bacterium]
MRLRILIAILLFPMLAHAESSALIISGAPGDDEHVKKYTAWTESTRLVLVGEMGFNPGRIMVLSGEKSTQAEIKDSFAKLKEQLKPADTLLLVLIGHGSFDGEEYKFNNVGPDLSGSDFNKLLATLNAGRIVVVNSTSSSGGATEAMAGKNRMIIAATKTGFEGNDTVFYEYFLNGLQKAAADENKDHKVSVWEAFKFAVDGVERFYKDAGRIATEHPQISDNGAPMTGVVPQVPVLAGLTSLNVDRPVAVADAKLQVLLNEQKEIQQKIETLQINKASMLIEDFNKQIEDLILQLALKGQQIEELKKK